MRHKDGKEIMAFENEVAFESWIKQNYNQYDALWVRLYKKGSGVATITYKQAVDVALCWGWIDGLVNKLDDASYIQRFTPRRSRSIWSTINKENIARLTKAGRMRPPGLMQVKAAQADGRWRAAYAPSSQATLPDDLLKLVGQESSEVRDFVAGLNRANIHTIYFQLTTAKRPATRERRLQNILTSLRNKQTAF